MSSLSSARSSRHTRVSHSAPRPSWPAPAATSGTSNPPASGGSATCRRRSSSRRSRSSRRRSRASPRASRATPARKGWEVIVQDPNFDPTKQAQSLNEVLELRPGRCRLGHRGRPRRRWAPCSSRPRRRASRSWSTAAPTSTASTARSRASRSTTSTTPRPARRWASSWASASTPSSAARRSVLFFAGRRRARPARRSSRRPPRTALKATAPDATIVQTLVANDRPGAQTDVGNVAAGQPRPQRGHGRQRRGRARCARRLRGRRQGRCRASPTSAATTRCWRLSRTARSTPRSRCSSRPT